MIDIAFDAFGGLTLAKKLDDQVLIIMQKV
jgi:hypothetical protein